MSWIFWNSLRILLTLAGVYTISRFTYPIVPFGPLMICAIIAIAVIRIWMPGSKPEEAERRFDGFTF